MDTSHPASGLITKAQLAKGTWFGTTASTEVLVDTAYASTQHITAGQILTVDSQRFTVAGLVNPTLTGDTADLYFSLPTLQSLANDSGRVNEVLVKVTNAAKVGDVAAAIRHELPGAQVLTAKSLADQVSGSLSNARTLSTHSAGHWPSSGCWRHSSSRRFSPCPTSPSGCARSAPSGPSAGHEEG